MRKQRRFVSEVAFAFAQLEHLQWVPLISMALFALSNGKHRNTIAFVDVNTRTPTAEISIVCVKLFLWFHMTFRPRTLFGQGHRA